MEVGGQLHTPAVLPQSRKLGWSQSRLSHFAEKTLVLPGIEALLLGCSLRRPSLYTGYAVRLLTAFLNRQLIGE